MADMIQCVIWALGQHCPLRQGPDWQDPGKAAVTLAKYRTYSSLRNRKTRGFGVYGDVCVTSVTPALGTETKRVYYLPCSGFLLSAVFSAAGGLASLHELCGKCPANLDAGGIAGCRGAFHQALYSKELQAQLDRLIDRLGLASTLDSVFPSTKLHSFRFWIQSPLPTEGAPALLRLFQAIYEEDQIGRKPSAEPVYSQQGDLKIFLNSLQCAINRNLPLHVHLAPPGHTDFGYWTTFSHCPRCKAEAPVKRWRKTSDEEISCPMCGVKYFPAKTSSEKRFDEDSDSVRDQLSRDEFEKLAIRCLLAQGAASEAEAAQIVKQHEAE